MGGMITILTQHLFMDVDLSEEQYVDQDLFLDIKELEKMRMIQILADNFIYKVFNTPYCYLPHNNISITRKVANPYVFPKTFGEQEEVQEPPFVPQQQTYGEASSSSSIDLSSLQNQLSFMQSEMEANSYYSRALYHNEVNRGHIDPYVNFPYHPPQAGPVPGWNNNQPTYPYWPTRADSVGYDYRQSGGSNPMYDPNIPPFYGGVPPPGYHERVDLLDSFQGNLPPGFSLSDDENEE